MSVSAGFAALMFIPLLAGLIGIGLGVLFKGAAQVVRGIFGG